MRVGKCLSEPHGGPTSEIGDVRMSSVGIAHLTVKRRNEKSCLPTCLGTYQIFAWRSWQATYDDKDGVIRSISLVPLIQAKGDPEKLVVDLLCHDINGCLR